MTPLDVLSLRQLRAFESAARLESVSAAALPQLAWGFTPSIEGLAEDATARPIRIEGGHVEVSDRPGLGIDVDEDRIRRHRRDTARRHVA